MWTKFKEEEQNEQEHRVKKLAPIRLNFASLRAQAGESDTTQSGFTVSRKPFIPLKLAFSRSDLEGFSDTPPKKDSRGKAKTVNEPRPNVTSQVGSHRGVQQFKSAARTGNMPTKHTTLYISKARKATNAEIKELPKKSLTTSHAIVKQSFKAKTVSRLKMPSIIATPSPESCLAEIEFVNFEKLILKDECTPDNKLSCEHKVLKLIEEDRQAALKMQQDIKDFISLQEKRHNQIAVLLNKRKTSENKHSENYMTFSKRNGSQSDGKILKKTNQTELEDKGMKKALGLYNSMRSLSKTILNTPKMNRTSLETPQSTRQRKSFSISKVIQKQCLMLHDTPSNQ